MIICLGLIIWWYFCGGCWICWVIFLVGILVCELRVWRNWWFLFWEFLLRFECMRWWWWWWKLIFCVCIRSWGLNGWFLCWLKRWWDGCICRICGRLCIWWGWCFWCWLLFVSIGIGFWIWRNLLMWGFCGWYFVWWWVGLLSCIGYWMR